MADDKTPVTKGSSPVAAASDGNTGGTSGGGSGGGVKSGGLVDQIISQGRMARDDSQIPAAKAMLTEFVSQLSNAPKGSVGDDTYAFIVSSIANIDRQLSTQMDQIVHDPDFQTLEASWRGLNNLVMNSETGERLKIRVLCATKDELVKDLETAVEFDQSQLFKKVYEEEYGTYGGNPYSCLIGDYDFGRNPQDIELATLISGVAAAAMAPFIASANPTMFSMDAFTELSGPRDMAKLFDSTDAIKWNSFRDTDDSRYFTLTLPRVLIRLPYGPATVPVDTFNYQETVDGTDNTKFCWGSPAYALGQRITEAFSLYGWTAAIRGVEGGGMVSDLPAYTYKTTNGDTTVKIPTEVAITDRREKELSDLGFMSLCYCKGTDYAAFFGGQTTQRPKVYDQDSANANASISARLPYMLNASRFGHYIKVMMRDKIGSFMSRQEVSHYLNNWIGGYVLLSDVAPLEVKSKFPLRQARVDVLDVPGKPGSYKAVVFLRPHFQLEELTASIRLVATLPPPVTHL